MKLKKIYLSNLSESERKDMCEEYEDLATVNKLWNNYSTDVIDAEIAVAEDGTVYDYRIFDPHHYCGNAAYINFEGWSNWLCEYRDLQGNNIDAIFDEYDGELQNKNNSMNRTEQMVGQALAEMGEQYKSIELLSEERINDEAVFAKFRITYDDEVYEIPFIVYSNGVFMPSDWQGWLPQSASEIDLIKWAACPERNASVFMINGLPRIF